jgi:CBS domain-containing protein
MLRLRDIMTREVFTVSPELPLSELVELFTERHISGAPVASGRTVAGVVSVSDLLSFALRSAQRPLQPEAPESASEWDDEEALLPLDSAELTEASFRETWDATDGPIDSEVSADGRTILNEYSVADVMSNDVLWLSPDTSVVTAAEFMKHAGIHRLLVMEKGELLGIVSSMDIVNAVANRQIPAAEIVVNRVADFDSGWSHEPIVPEPEG